MEREIRSKFFKSVPRETNDVKLVLYASKRIVTQVMASNEALRFGQLVKCS